MPVQRNVEDRRIVFEYVLGAFFLNVIVRVREIEWEGGSGQKSKEKKMNFAGLRAKKAQHDECRPLFFLLLFSFLASSLFSSSLA